MSPATRRRVLLALPALALLAGTAACAKAPPAASDKEKEAAAASAVSTAPSARGAPSASGAPSVSVSATEAPPRADAGAVDASADAGADASADVFAFQLARNLEMVPYCLPYPSAYLEEDRSERWEHGRKVFTARSRTRGVKPSRMDLAGTCGPRSLKELFEADRKDIEAEVPRAVISVSRLERDSYALSWRIGDRIHYGKMWTAKGDAGCFVRATFDYDARERAAFDTIIARVVRADPACAPP